MSGGSSQPSTQTVTQMQQIPQWEQDYAQGNQNIAASLASQPYPNYKGQIVAPHTALQDQAIASVPGAANSYQPAQGQAEQMTQGAMRQSIDPNGILSGPNANQNWNSGAASQYMNPYVMAALQPQLQQLGIQQGQQQRNTDAQATQAGAFGDSRHGVESALNNYYSQMADQGVIGQGLANAYSTGQSAFQNDQGRNLQAFQTALQGGQNEQNIQLAGGAQMGTLAAQRQQLGLTGANAIYGAGQQQQTQQQTENNAAYQQYQNQVNWPQQMLNVRESALSNSPYNITNSTTLPGANSAASNLGLFAQLLGAGGSLTSGSSAPFGGTPYKP